MSSGPLLRPAASRNWIRFGFCRRVCGEYVVPEGLDVAAQLCQPITAGAVVSARAIAFVHNETSLTQNSQVLRHCGLRDSRALGELPHRMRPPAQLLVEATSRRVGEGQEDRCIGHGLY